MTVRGAFIPKMSYPYFEEIPVAFQWFGGFAVQQKKRCATAMHIALIDAYPDFKPLEISSASGYTLGHELSAMNLRKSINPLGGYTPVESAFQSSRIYRTADNKQIGPFPEYLMLDGRTAKRCVKEKSQGLYASEYLFEGRKFPVPDFHISLFYDYLYLNALTESQNKGIALELINQGFNCFTDLATKALNSQARSCAIFVSLYNLGLLDNIKSYDDFMTLFRVNINAPKYAAQGAYENVQLLDKRYPLGVTQYRDVVVQRVSEKEIQDHYNTYKGAVTRESLFEMRGVTPVGATMCRHIRDIFTPEGTLTGYILQDMQGKNYEFQADKVKQAIRNGALIVLNKAILDNSIWW